MTNYYNVFRMYELLQWLLTLRLFALGKGEKRIRTPSPRYFHPSICWCDVWICQSDGWISQSDQGCWCISDHCSSNSCSNCNWGGWICDRGSGISNWGRGRGICCWTTGTCCWITGTAWLSLKRTAWPTWNKFPGALVFLVSWGGALWLIVANEQNIFIKEQLYS